MIRHERELNFTELGKLAATRLGRWVFLEAVLKAMLASGFRLVGALFPLTLCLVAPSPPWLGLAIAIIALSGLGALLARTIFGLPLLWGVGQFGLGIVLALVGMQLNLVGQGAPPGPRRTAVSGVLHSTAVLDSLADTILYRGP